MLREAIAFIKSIESKHPPRWLSLCGSNGAGKTFLARRIFNYVRRNALFRADYDPAIDDIRYACEFVHWPTVAKELQSGRAREWVEQITQTHFVVLDDIGAARDTTGYITGELSTLLGRRTGRWAVLTSNLGVMSIAENMDRRISSRMIRDGSVVVEVNTKDFSLRNL